MTRTRWIIFAAIVILTLGGMVALSNKETLDVDNVDVNAIVTEGDNADYVYGNPDAKVVVIEYADFQCPGCSAAYPNVNSIKETYKDQVAFVFRHFPLTSIHPNALAASSVAEAAVVQGKFWEMHNLLFESVSSWDSLKAEERGSVFESLATQLGLNIDQFNTDLASKKIADKITYQRAVGGKATVNSTPSFFVNGEMISSEATLDLIQASGAQFKERIEAAIKATGGTVTATKPE